MVEGGARKAKTKMITETLIAAKEFLEINVPN